MRGAAAAFAWEFRKRLEWGAVAYGVYLGGLALVQFVLLGERSPVRPSNPLIFAFTVTVPAAFAFMYALAVFSHGLSGDIAARASLYPQRLFTLPVSTTALAGLPMAYGGATIAALWLAVALVGFAPSGAPVPLLWPALFGAALVAWMQALAWTPYPLPGLRIVIAVILLTLIDVVVLIAIELHVPNATMAALMAPQVPLAYLVARRGVDRARCGDTPDWRGAFSRLARAAETLPGRRRPFATPAHAQQWLEWRQHGASLPVWTAILLPFQAFFLYLVRHEQPALTVIGLGFMALTPPFLAVFVALRADDLTAFAGTRPLSTPALVAAKLRMAVRTTLLTWLLVAIAIPVALTLAGRWPLVTAKVHGMAGIFGVPRTVLLNLLALALLLVATWKQLVQGLAIGLTGRPALVKASAIARLSWLVALGVFLRLLSVSPDVRRAFFGAIPWLPAIPIALKTGAAAWIATQLRRRRLLGDRTLATGAALWLAAVLALDAVLAWILSHLPHAFLLMCAILAVPLVRPAAVLLALGSNRHRGRISAEADAAGARSRALRAAVLLVATPALVASVAFVAFQVRNRDNGRLVSSGLERSYRLYVPRSYDPARPTPLVISLHGATLWGAAQMELSRWNPVADEEGFIVVYPTAYRSGALRVWKSGGIPLSEIDVRFIADLIDALRASYNIDPARIYADGLSNGGGMAHLLSCTLGDRIAAVGMVGAAHFLPWSRCTDARPVPMIAFHGTDDTFAPYFGGERWIAAGHAFPSIPDFTARWARRNRCDPSPAEVRIAPDVTRLSYGGCAEGADVALYTIHDGGHTWPDGGYLPEWFAGRTTHSVNAARESWRFFQAHPLRGPLP